jgi:hypothetical protein
VIEIKAVLTSSHKDEIIEACFDWMVNDGKTVPKAYPMKNLFVLKPSYAWIRQELAMIISTRFSDAKFRF